MSGSSNKAPTEMHRAAGNIHWAIIGQCIVSASNLATTLLLTWFFDLSTFGQYSICLLIALFFRNLMDGALLHPVGSIGPKVGPKSLAIYRAFIATSFGAYVIISMLIYILGQLLFENILHIRPITFAISPVVAFIGSFLIAEFLRNYLLIFGWRLAVVIFDILRGIVQLSLLLTIISTGGSWKTLEFVLYSQSIGAIIASLPFFILFGELSWRPSKWRIFVIRHFRFIRWGLPSILFRYLQTNIPFYWAAAVLGTEVIGAARATQTVANIINIPVLGLRSIAPAISARLYKLGGLVAMQNFLKQIVVIVSLANAAIISVLIVFSDFIVETMFGPEVGPYSYMLWVYCLINAMMMVNLGLTSGFQALEMPKVLATRFFAGAVIAAVLSVLFMEDFGAPALPSIQLITSLTGVVFFWAQFQRLRGTHG